MLRVVFLSVSLVKFFLLSLLFGSLPRLRNKGNSSSKIKSFHVKKRVTESQKFINYTVQNLPSLHILCKNSTEIGVHKSEENYFLTIFVVNRYRRTK